VKRREFITLLGGAAIWPLTGQAQGPEVRTIGYLSPRSADVEKEFLIGYAPSLYLVDSGFTETSWIDQFPLSRICALY
jgi:hypothetical protein